MSDPTINPSEPFDPWKDALDHPAWCQPRRCEVGLGRAHSSETLTVVKDRQGGSTSRLQLRIYQFDVAIRPMLELTVGDHESGHRCRVDMSMRQAGALKAGLGVLLDRLVKP